MKRFFFWVVRNLYHICTRSMHLLHLLTDMILVSVLVLVLVANYIIAWPKIPKGDKIYRGIRFFRHRQEKNYFSNFKDEIIHENGKNIYDKKEGSYT